MLISFDIVPILKMVHNTINDRLLNFCDKLKTTVFIYRGKDIVRSKQSDY